MNTVIKQRPVCHRTKVYATSNKEKRIVGIVELVNVNTVLVESYNIYLLVDAVAMEVFSFVDEFVLGIIIIVKVMIGFFVVATEAGVAPNEMRKFSNFW